MPEDPLLDVARRIFAGDREAGKDLATLWSAPLDRRLGLLSLDNQRRAEIMMESVLDEFQGGRKSPEAFVQRLREVDRLVDGMERIVRGE